MVGSEDFGDERVPRIFHLLLPLQHATTLPWSTLYWQEVVTKRGRRRHIRPRYNGANTRRIRSPRIVRSAKWSSVQAETADLRKAGNIPNRNRHNSRVFTTTIAGFSTTLLSIVHQNMAFRTHVARVFVKKSACEAKNGLVNRAIDDHANSPFIWLGITLVDQLEVNHHIEPRSFPEISRFVIDLFGYNTGKGHESSWSNAIMYTFCFPISSPMSCHGLGLLWLEFPAICVACLDAWCNERG